MMAADVDNPADTLSLVARLIGHIDRNPGRLLTPSELADVPRGTLDEVPYHGYCLRLKDGAVGWWPPKHRTAELARAASERGDSDEAARLLAALYGWHWPADSCGGPSAS